MPLYASGVTIPSDLSGAISGPATSAYNTIGAGYNNATQKMASDARARGLRPGAGGPNSYGGNQLAVGQGLATGNLESALGSGLGSTAYQNTLQQRQFGQNEDLARQVAALNRPDLLQSILGGVGDVGGTAAQIYGAFGKNARPQTTGPAFPQGQSQLNMPFTYPMYQGGGY
jgi:hypothetical protein